MQGGRIAAMALGAGVGLWGAWAWARSARAGGDANDGTRKSRLRDALVLRGVTLRRCSPTSLPRLLLSVYSLTLLSRVLVQTSAGASRARGPGNFYHGRLIRGLLLPEDRQAAGTTVPEFFAPVGRRAAEMVKNVFASSGSCLLPSRRAFLCTGRLF